MIRKIGLELSLVMAVAAPACAAQAAPAAGRQKVLGIGGVFFRAHDPEALNRWYLDNLGIDLHPTSYDQTPWRQQAGVTNFEAFPADSDYFGDPDKVWMLNFRVKDLDAMAAQLRAAGVEVKIDPQTYPNGRFARIKDPEGNPVELWEPMAPAKSGR